MGALPTPAWQLAGIGTHTEASAAKTEPVLESIQAVRPPELSEAGRCRHQNSAMANEKKTTAEARSVESDLIFD
ncbi:hypothetical protein PGTUg99_031798 [Puccinia graminis f. sp. tritici]|uniref:Uncharacterized protein n=1 Tax=Puccinia graminis f. sp. tritici TaxID=56615 RepID=A0A5B0PLR5_PUCGR|nr:hypothetical protein PGTUg99_031798 [Puccinia graminis f. sp. tritici]